VRVGAAAICNRADRERVLAEKLAELLTNQRLIWGYLQWHMIVSLLLLALIVWLVW